MFVAKRSVDDLMILLLFPGLPASAARPSKDTASLTNPLTDKSSSSHHHTNHWGFCLFLDVSHNQILSGDFSSLKRFANIIIIIFAHKLIFFWFV